MKILFLILFSATTLIACNTSEDSNDEYVSPGAATQIPAATQNNSTAKTNDSLFRAGIQQPASSKDVAPVTTSAPATQSNQSAITTVSTPTAATTQQVKTRPGMNPPHGEPNHRCDIAVGAPLSTPVAKTQSTTTTAIASPVTKVSTQKTAPGMNPPHGEPNHRCDIAVGAPLNSPVVKPAELNTTTSSSPATTIPPIPNTKISAEK